MTHRRIARAVIITAIALFALVAAPRLHLVYTPTLALPQLQVQLLIGGGIGDADEATTRWIIPIESAIRSLGDVTATRTDVTRRGASILVRFRRNTDVETRAARLSSELSSVRQKLPARSRLDVWPVSESSDQPAALIALTGTLDDPGRIAGELRSAVGVREVVTYGLTEREVEIVMTSGTVPVAAVVEALDTLAPRTLGTIDRNPRGDAAREVAVVAAPSIAAGSATRFVDLREVLVRSGTTLLPLRAVADVRNHEAAARTLARVDGKPATMLAVYRDDDVSLFTFDASIRQTLQDVSHEMYGDATTLRTMLIRCAVGAALASLLLAIIGFVLAGWRGTSLALYVPVALAVAINAFWLTSTKIDAQTIIITIIAFAGLTPFAAWRLVSQRQKSLPLVIAALFVLLLPLATTIGSGALSSFLAPAAQAFVLAAASAILACLTITPGAVRVVPARWQRTVLRESATVLLAAATVSAALLTYFGARLDPRSAGETESSTLAIHVNLPPGTTLSQTSEVVGNIEKRLTGIRGIERFVSFIEEGWGSITIELKPDMNESMRRLRLLFELQARVAFIPGMISLDDRTGGRPVQLTDELELTPFTDSEASAYRVLLKGTDAEALRRSVDLIASRLSRLDIRRSAIESDWPAATHQILVSPRQATTPAETARMAARLVELTSAPSTHRLHDGRLARIVAWGAPPSADVVPQRAELTVREPSLTTSFDLRPEYVAGGAMRELGRFVLPLTIEIPGAGDSRIGKRADVDRTLSTMTLPPGISLERPSLSKWSASLPKLRLLALATTLPLLLFIAASIVLSSIRGALAAIASSLIGFAGAAPALMLARSFVDELTLLAMGASLCCVTAVAVVTLLRSRETTAKAYRAQRQFFRPTLFALVAVLVLLSIPPTAANAAMDGWRAPMFASLAVLGFGIPAALLVAPAAGFVIRDVQRRRTPVARAARHPDEWRRTTPHLAIRNVTKTYTSGFRALHRVSFELTPGITGLLGPNGAGKTTLLRIMTGLLLPTRGQLLNRGVPVGPHNLAEYRRLIGFLPQEFNAYAGLTAFDFLDFWSLERGLIEAAARRSEVEQLLELVGLTQDRNRRVRDFSGGMRQRIGIARALLGNPPLLVVDEPTTGLDLESRNHFRDILTTLATDRIIILSTHIAGDVAATASRILLLTKGALRWDGAPGELIARARGRVFETVVADSEARSLTNHFHITTRHRVAAGIHMRGVVAAGVALPGEAAEPNLEEAYLAEVAGDRSVRSRGFAFIFGEKQVGPPARRP